MPAPALLARTARSKLATALACAAGALAAAGAEAAVTESVTFQADPAHSGFVDDPALRPPLQRAWSREIGVPAGAALVVGDRVFVSVRDRERNGNVLYALDRGTGATLWRRASRGGVSYDAGRLFVAAGSGLVQALDPATGEALWTIEATGLLRDVMRPVATGGLVHLQITNSGSTAVALRQSDGSQVWQAGLGDAGSITAVAGGKVLHGGGWCKGDLAHDAATGVLQWQQVGRCDVTALENAAAVVHQGRVYSPGGTIRDLATGAARGTFESLRPPAFSGATGVFVDRGGLSARDVVTNAERWRRDEPEQVTTPLIVGTTVYAATRRGTVLALDLATGAVLDDAAIGRPYGNATYDEPPALAAGGGTLVVPDAEGVTAFVAKDAAAPTPVQPPAEPALTFDPVGPLTGAEDDARTAQLNRTHDGFLRTGTPAPPLRRRWSVELQGGVQPLIADGKVFAIADRPTDQTGLWAFDQRDGTRLWRAPLDLGSYEGAGFAYDAGRVFVTVQNRVRAFDAATGRQLWRTPIMWEEQGGRDVQASPIAFSGVVYVTGSNRLIALSQSDGSELWDLYVGGQPGTPASDGSTAWLATLCGGYTAIDLATRQPRTDIHACTHGGANGGMPIMAGDRVLAGRLLDANSGRPLDDIAGAPAVAHGLRIALDGRVLTATPLDGGRERWQFRGDGWLSTMPVVVGRTVFVGSRRGRVYALDVETGRRLWSDELGAQINRPFTWGEHGFPGLAAGEGLLVVPTDRRLFAYEPAAAGGAGDDVPPQTTATPLPDPVRTRDPLVQFASSEPEGAAYDCSLDGYFWRPCSAPHRLIGLEEGAHVLRLRAIDAAGNVDPTPARLDFRVDAAPDTYVRYGPNPRDYRSTIDIGIGGSEPGDDYIDYTFECRSDGSGWGSCGESVRLSGLAEGPHWFEARATDPGGTVDPTPLRIDWIVDTVKPAGLTITAPADGSVTGDPTPALSGTAGTAPADDDRVEWWVYEQASFGERLLEHRSATVTGGRWAAEVTERLWDGAYRLEVTQGDGAYNVTSAEVRFSVSTADPETQLSGPGEGEVTRERSPYFGYWTDKPGASFECRLDGAAWGACEQFYFNLADGPHRLEARAVDDAGRADPTPAVRNWRIDTVVPQVTISSPANGSSVTDSNVTVTGVAGRALGDGDTVFIDVSTPEHGPVLSQSPPPIPVGADGRWSVTLPPLPDGAYHVYVTQRDAADNVGGAIADFSVADPDPETVIDPFWAPWPLTRERDATFNFSATKPDGRFECRLDGAAWTPCTSTWRLFGIPDGDHRFEVRSITAAGAVEAEPASWEWTSDATAPVVRVESPTDRQRLDDHTPVLRGTAGTAPGDEPEVCVGIQYDELYRYRCVPVVDGRWEAEMTPAVEDGEYLVSAGQLDEAGNSGVSPRIDVLIGEAAASLTAPAPTGGATPSPSPTATPTATATATASPTATATASPTATATASPSRRHGHARARPPRPPQRRPPRRPPRSSPAPSRRPSRRPRPPPLRSRARPRPRARSRGSSPGGSGSGSRCRCGRCSPRPRPGGSRSRCARPAGEVACSRAGGSRSPGPRRARCASAGLAPRGARGRAGCDSS